MNFNRLKELARKLGGILVLDGDKPEFVILSYDKYENIEQGEEIPFSTERNGLARPNGRAGRTTDTEGDQETVEKLNQEILALKDEIRQKEEAELQSGELARLAEASGEAQVESVENEQSTEPIAEVVDPAPFVD